MKVKLKLHYSFFLFLFLMLFTSKYIELVILIISILLHEFAHMLSAFIFGIRKFKIEITMFGGVCYFDTFKLNKRQKIIMYFSGITSNLILIIIFKIVHLEILSPIIIKFNLVMLIFSMLPIYPLDGFWLMETVFIKKIKNISIFLLVFALFFTIYSREGSFTILFLFLLFKNINYEKEDTNRRIISKWSCLKENFSV